MSHLQERWQGVSLPGDYLLQRWVDGDDGAGFFDSATPDGNPVTVKLAPQTDASGAAQLALWQRAQALRHPNLRRVLDFGRAELEGEIVGYLVLEKADDTLASALSQGSLSENEAREVLDAVLGALRHLQSHGLACGALDPEHVVAVGDTIKLSTDGLRDAPPAAPFRSELRQFWEEISPSPPVRRQEILAAALSGEAAAEPPAPRRDPVPPALHPVPDAGAIAADSPGPVSLPAAPESPPTRIASPDSASPNRFPKWILVGAAGVVLLVLGLNLRRSPDAPAQRVPPPAPVAAAPASPSPVPAAPKPTPFGTRPAPARETRTAAKSDPRPPSKRETRTDPAGQAKWRVIAFTYRTRDAALRKAEQVNQRHPEFAATVFSPKEAKGFYLIALGGRMTHDEALRVQKQARVVSRDIYVQNYVE